MAKILLVDDEIDLIEMLRIRLEVNGYDVIDANDGIEGLTKARSERPDLIILDIMMPNMDGFAMLREVRQDDAIKHIPIIMCSGKDADKAAMESRRAGANEYIMKPVESPILLETIERLLNNSSG